MFIFHVSKGTSIFSILFKMFILFKAATSDRKPAFAEHSLDFLLYISESLEKRTSKYLSQQIRPERKLRKILAKKKLDHCIPKTSNSSIWIK